VKHIKVSLYVRERGTRRYNKVPDRNKPYYPSNTTYVLRYGLTWETLTIDNLSDAVAKRIERELELLRGWRPTSKPKPEPSGKKVKMLDEAIDAYLKEVESGRKPKTHSAYTTSLNYFFESTGNKPMSTISRTDLLDFTVFLREEKQQSDRSCWNKFANVMSFLKLHDITGKSLKIKPHDWPQYVEEEPEIYEQDMLDVFFAACDEDEFLLFEFFLKTGMREQEVIYATDRCLDFSANTVTVRKNPSHGWTPKMYKERTIPVPASLMTKLKKMLVGRGKGGLIFPTKNGQPKLNFLDMAKAVARRAGIPEEEVWLHKFRATFATRALWAGVDLRTVQAWMGHTDLASTMRYLRPQRDAAVRQKVEAIWG
jgi:integrase/recombinase XerD